MPPAIIAVAISIGASYAASITVISLTTAMIISTLATVAAAMLMKQSIPNFGSFKDQQERKQVMRAAAASRTAVIGRTVSSGVLVFAEEQPWEQDENEWIHLVLVIAAHEIDHIGEVWFGDENAKTYASHSKIMLYNNPQTAPQYLLDNCPSWKSDMIGKGLAYLVVSMRYDQEKFPAGLPNIKVEKFGWKCYDPRQNKTQWTNNAALVILHYYRNYIGVPDTDIDFESFKQGATICDEQVTRADGKKESRYTINGEFETDEAIAKILDAMLESCAGEPTYIAGKHGLIVGAYYGPASYNLTDDDIIGDVKLVSETAYRDKVNTVTGTFIDPEQGFAEVDYPPVSVPEWVAADKREMKDDKSYRFVTSEYQAQRLSNITLRRKRLGRTIEVAVNLRGYKMRPGRYVNLTIRSLGIKNQEFRVTKWGFSIKNAVTLTLRQETRAVWDDAVGQFMDRGPLTSLPTGGVPAPDNLDYEVEVVGDVVQGLLTWTNGPAQIAYNNVVIKKGTTIVYTVQVPGQLVRLNGLVEGTYTAEVYAVSVMGARSRPSALAFTIRAPVAPTVIDISTSLWQVTLRPRMNDALLASTTTFEFWYYSKPLTIPEVTAKAVLIATSNNLTHDNLQPGTTYYYWIRGVNAYGKSSFVPIIATTASDPGVILDVIAGQIGGEALTDELKKLIDDAVTQEELNRVEAALKASDADLQKKIDNIEIGVNEDLEALVNSTTEVVGAARDEIAEVSKGVMENAFNVETEALMQRKRYALVVNDVTIIQDDQQSMVQTVDGILVKYDDQQAQILNVNKVVADEKQATAQRFESTNAAITTETGKIDANVETLTVTTATADAAISKRIDTVESTFTGELGKTNAAITQLDKTTAAADSAMATRVTGLEAKVGANTAAITTESTVRADADSALTTQITNLRSDMVKEDTKINASITTMNTTLTNADTAIAKSVTDLRADMVSEDKKISAGLTTETTARVDADKALTTSISGLSSKYDGHDATIKTLQKTVADNESATSTALSGLNTKVGENATAIASETTARSTADTALGKRIDTVTAESGTTKAGLASEITARTTADTALSTRIDTMNAQVGKNTAAITTEATTRADADTAQAKLITGLRTDTDGNKAAITAETTARSNADSALTRRVDTMSTTVGENTAAIQVVAETASNVSGDFNAMWGVKASINDVVGGFGLVAQKDPDGQTRIKFIADVDTFAVVGRNAGVRNPFVIRNGIVYINKLLADDAEFASVISKYIKVNHIESATMVSSVITASNIRASNIVSHQWDATNGQEGFGLDGTSGWMGAQNAVIKGSVTATSGVFNGDIYANNGWFRGTVYADKIEGDVVAAGMWPAFELFGVNDSTWRYFHGGFSYETTLIVPSLIFKGNRQSASGWCGVRVNGVETIRLGIREGILYSGSLVINVPPNGTVNLEFLITGASSGALFGMDNTAVMTFRKGQNRFS